MGTIDLSQMNEADRALTSKFGYKPVFKREFGFFSTFSFAVSIGGLFSTISTTLIYPIQAGGSASAVWCMYLPRCAYYADIGMLIMTSKAGWSQVLVACALQ